MGNDARTEPSTTSEDGGNGRTGMTGDTDEEWARMEDEANRETFREVVRCQRQLRGAAEDRVDELVARAHSSMRWIQAMAAVTFVVGLVLLGLGVWKAVAAGSVGLTDGSLGFAGGGLAALLGVLLYRPMERVQRASSDLAQQETLLRAWSLSLDLELMAADPFDRDTVRQAAQQVQQSSQRFSRSLEAYVEEGVQAGSREEPSQGTQSSSASRGPSKR